MVKSCSVFGHSKIEETGDLKNKLIEMFKELIVQGCEIFYFGGFGMFDELCYRVISELKEFYPHIKRVFCLVDPRRLRKDKRPKWINQYECEDYIYLQLSFDWWYQRIYFRNCAMIDISDFIVFYVEEGSSSGANKALNYAKRKKKDVRNLFW